MKNIFPNVMALASRTHFAARVMVLASRARFAARVMVLASLLASPLLAAPTPTAVWTTGQFCDAASDHGGYAITLNSGNSTNEAGNITIGSSATLGATVDVSAGDFTNASFLVKYTIPSGGAPANNAVPVSFYNAYDFGPFATSGSSSLSGYWLDGSTFKSGNWDFSSPAPSLPQEGYILISTWAIDPNPSTHGTAVYAASSISALAAAGAGGEAADLRFTGTNNRVTKIGIGGPTTASASGAVPWADMVIESVALFGNSFLSPSDIADYTFPEPEEPEEPEEPIEEIDVSPATAVWLSGEFGDASYRHGGYRLALNGNSTNENGNIVIGSDTSLGATIIVSRSGCTKASMLVKYKAPAGGAPVANAVFAGVRGTDNNPIGAYCKTAGGSTLEGFYMSGSSITSGYAFSGAPAASAGSGWMLFTFESYSGTTNGTAVYLGSSPTTLSGGDCPRLQWGGQKVSMFSIGGPTNAGDAKPWAGLEIEAIAIFTGERLESDSDLVANYVFPEKGGPVIAKEPDYPILPYVTRLDGTVYHGNDANRAVITNWQTQILRPASRPVPTGKSDADFKTIDVLYVYDTPGKEYIEQHESPWKGASAIEVFSAKATARMNQIIATTDMDTNFWFRMVGAVAVEGSGGTIANILGKCELLKDEYSLVLELRDHFGADVIVTPTLYSGGYGGLARLNTLDEIKRGGQNAAYHFASVLLSYSQTHAWVHEIGHNMSLNHYAPAGFDPANTWRGLGLQHKVSEADGTSFSTVMAEQGYSDFCGGFSSVNHIYHGSMLSQSNHLDSTGVMLEAAPYVSKWREKKIEETQELVFTPTVNSFISADTHCIIEYSDPDAKIYYKLNDYLNELDFVEYTGPIPLTAGVFGNYNYIQAYAVTNGYPTEVKQSSYITNPNDDEALGSPGLSWSTARSNSTGGWNNEGLDYYETVDNFANDPSKSSVSVLSTAIRGPAALTFTHSELLKDNPYYHGTYPHSFPDSSFVVWVDDEPAYSIIGAADTLDTWVDTEISIPDGFHTVEFVFTHRSGYVSGEKVRIKNVSVNMELSENPTSLSLTGGSLPAIDKWTTANWRDQENLRFAGNWDGLSLPATITAATNLALSIDTPLSVSSLAVAGDGLVTLRGLDIDFAGPVTVGGSLALDVAHSNANYTVASGGKLSGTGAILGSATVESGATLSGDISIDDLTLAGGATVSGGGAMKSLSYSGSGDVTIEYGSFTIAPGCDTTGFSDASVAMMHDAEFTIYSPFHLDSISFQSQSEYSLYFFTNTYISATSKIDFMSSTVKINLCDEYGRTPVPGRYKVAEAPVITSMYEQYVPGATLITLNNAAATGLSFSIETEGAMQALYATVAAADVVDAADPTPVSAGELDGAYVNVSVVNADSLAVGDELTVLTATKITNCVPNVLFADSRTAPYSTVARVSDTSVSVTRTDFNFTTANGDIACSIPLVWAEECISGKEGDAMEIMRTPNENGIAPWEAYLLGFAAEDADIAKLLPYIELDSVTGSIVVGLMQDGRMVPSQESVQLTYTLLGAEELGGEYAPLATGYADIFALDRSQFEERFFRVRVNFDGIESFESDAVESEAAPEVPANGE